MLFVFNIAHPITVNFLIFIKRVAKSSVCTYIHQGLIQDFLLGGGNRIFEEILDIFGQQNRLIQL